MTLLKKILTILSDMFNVQRQKREIAEAYLSKAVDLADLEARQRYLTRMGYL